MKEKDLDYYTDKFILAASSGFGKYSFEVIKQNFGEPDNIDDLLDDWSLATDTGNEAHDWYHEAQEQVIQDAIWTIDGNPYRIMMNEDVWFIPADIDYPDDFWDEWMI